MAASERLWHGAQRYIVRMTSGSRLRYLSAADVLAAMPTPQDQLRLAERTLRALAGSADLPPKIGVHPRPAASFAHAMPAWLGAAGPGAASDLLGIKWVAGFPDNRMLDIPAIHATLLLSDASTGQLRAIIDAGGITAVRTAAVSGVAIGRWAPTGLGRPASVAVVGAGVQGESHLRMLAEVLPGCSLRLHDRDTDRAARLAESARDRGVFAEVTTSTTAAAAITGADVVVTMVSFGPDRQLVPVDAFAAARLVVTVDYDMCLPAEVARNADLFLVDEAGQFLANRASGVFVGYPDPAGIIGEHLDTPPTIGRVVVSHLGVGLADVVFGDAVLAAAERAGRGTILPR
jgi:ornithine cyclodeaminase/alanine dehydrogenase-like protein (mu-crystallin family)